MRLTFIALFVACAATPLRADVKLPAIFGDHMVLQRDLKTPVWGWADPNETVTVTVGEVKTTATAGADRKWRVTLDNLKASDQPIDLIVAGKNTITLHDVLIGDNWVCSGQSNMEFRLSGAHNAAEEIPKANHPTLRLFTVKNKIALEPQADCEGMWVLCTPETAPKFSAVGYFFARDVLQSQHVPIGMISTSWGGTPAQSWTSIEALKAVPELSSYAVAIEKLKANLPQLKQTFDTETLPRWQKDHDAWEKEVGKPYQQALAKWSADVAKAKAAGQPEPPKPVMSRPEPRKPNSPDNTPQAPVVLYNGMIAPIVPFGIKGAIWYQGESNAGASKEYQTLFPTMISDWRSRWGQGDFPFIWVQLANYRERAETPVQTVDSWPGLRDAQSKTLKLPNTAQAVIIDIGQSNDIHPRDKMDVGYRLSLAARHVAYGEDLVYSGPTFDSFQIDGDKIRVKFTNIGTGLTIAAAPSTQPGVPPASPASELKGFSIAGEDHKFVWAAATIEPSTTPGQPADTVIVSCPEVKEPKAVRYGWAINPEVNLYNKEGLPASPFRSDDWSNPPTETPKP